MWKHYLVGLLVSIAAVYLFARRPARPDALFL